MRGNRNCFDKISHDLKDTFQYKLSSKLFVIASNLVSWNKANDWIMLYNIKESSELNHKYAKNF